MSDQAMPADVVERAVVVRCRVTTAFEVFTSRIDAWWPKGHSRSGERDTTVLVEGQVGGRLYERTAAGVEHVWGQVLAWEPPHHFAYDWHLGSGSEQPSRVDVRFSDLGDGTTRVAVAHRGPELIGALWARNSPIYARSWEAILPVFAACCAQQR